MNSPAPDNSTLRNLTLAGLLGCALLAFAWWKSEVLRAPRLCQVCSVYSERRTLSLYGHAIGSWHTEEQKDEWTFNYFDRYLAYPHAHVWHEYDHIIPLTAMAYRLVAASGIPDPERRRRYFESIIQPPGEKHFQRVKETYLTISRQIPKEPPAEAVHYRIWKPDMKGITIPDEVKAGGLLPDPD